MYCFMLSFFVNIKLEKNVSKKLKEYSFVLQQKSFENKVNCHKVIQVFCYEFFS